MKKIIMILTNGFSPDVRVYKEAKYLVSEGYDVEILCWDRENEYVDREVEVVNGIKIKRFFPYSRYGTGIKQLKPFLQFIKECREYLEKKGYHYLHCHDIDGVIAGYFAGNNKAKLIFDMHEYYEVNGSKQKIRYIIKWVVNYFQTKSDFIIFVNESQTKTILKKNKQKSVYLPNYPEKEIFTGYKKSKSKALRVSYIGAVRQYDELKNLMDACIGMSDVKISIYGDGVAYNRLNNIKSNYKNVILTGKYDYTQSAKLYSETDILYALYPTSSMQYLISYPVKFFEAIVTNTPIIVNKGTVLEDFVNKYDIGFAVEGSNVQEIRELVKFINNDRNILDEKVKSLKKIQNEFSWLEVVKNLDKIYG